MGDLKKKYLRELLRVTKLSNFSGSEDDAEGYVNLINKRENIVSEIKLLDYKTREPLDDEEKNIINEILTLDGEISLKAKSAFSQIKKRVKEYHNGRNAAAAYAGSGADDGKYY
jgi:hypothetical protein